MDKNYWIHKLSIPSKSDVLFYQNPKFFRSNSFKREQLNDEIDKILKEVGKVNIFTISGVANNHHKHTGRREKICLVKEYLK